MRTKRKNYNLAFRPQLLSKWAVPALFLMMFNMNPTFAQEIVSDDYAIPLQGRTDVTRKLFGGRITNSGYGGIILKFSRFNDQFAFMTGGRGAFTINNRYTIGGGGYGIANSITLLGSGRDTSRYFKMGYGGIELGYIFLPAKKLNIGGSLLVAAGAAFLQSKPKSNDEKLFDDDFNIFPVMEPSLYSEISLNRLMWLHAGISYRFVPHTNLDYMPYQKMRGFSFYVGLLFGKPEGT